MSSDKGVQTAWVVATNVYLKTPQGWRLVLHHASAGSEGEAQEVAADAPTTLH
jgi:ketosteroid isomerase-like protein